MTSSAVARWIRRGRRLAQKLRRRSGAEWLALGLATGTVAGVALLLRICSFGRVRVLLGADRAPTPPFRLSADEEQRILWAVGAVSRRLFPTRPCLPQALAAQALLRWRGSSPAHLRIGVTRGPDGTLRAHAWLERDGAVLLGGAASPRLYRSLGHRGAPPEADGASPAAAFPPRDDGRA